MKLGCLTAKILNAACCLWSLLTVKLRKGTLTAPVSWIRTNLGGDCGGRWLWHQALSRGMWLMANKCWLLQTILRSYLLFAQKMVIRENELVTPGSNGIHLAIRVSPLEFLYNYTIWKTVWYEFKFMNSTAVSDVFISNVPVSAGRGGRLRFVWRLLQEPHLSVTRLENRRDIEFTRKSLICCANHQLPCYFPYWRLKNQRFLPQLLRLISLTLATVRIFCNQIFSDRWNIFWRMDQLISDIRRLVRDRQSQNSVWAGRRVKHTAE